MNTEEHIAKVLEAKTVEDLIALGTAESIAAKLSAYLKPFTLETDSYEVLLEALEVVRAKLPAASNSPFVNRHEEVVFYLTQTDGKVRKKLLNVTKAHYRDKDLAKKWFRSLASVVHTDKTGSDDTTPFIALQKMYDEMTFVGDEDE